MESSYSVLLQFLASNRQRSQIESSYSCPIYTSQHRIDRDSRQSLLTVVLFILLGIEQIKIVDRVFLQFGPICTSWHRIDRDRRQSLLTVVLFIFLSIEQIEIVDRVFLQLSYLHFLASNRQRQQIEVFLQLSYLHFLASNRQRQQIESSYSCPIYISQHRIDRDSNRVFLQLSYLYFLASNRQRSQIESSYSCPIYTSQHRIDRDRRQSLLTVVLFIFLSIEQIEIRRQSLLTVVLFALLGIEQIEIVDRVFLQLSYLYFLASNRQRSQIESSYSCPICTSWHQIDRDSRQSLLTVVLFALLGIEQIEIVDRVFLQLSYLYFLASNRIEIVDGVFLQLSYLYFLASNRQRSQIESSYSCPIYTSQHRIDRDSRQSLLTVVLFALLVIEQIEIVDRVFLQLSFLYFLASNRQRSQIESSYSCPIALLGNEQIEIVDRVFLQLSYLYFLASNRQRSQIESSYSCPICTSWHQIDRDSRQSLLTVVLFALLGIEQIEIVDRVFLQLSYLYSQHRIDRDRRQSLLTVVLFALLGIEQIEIVDRVFLQLSYLYFLASNRQRQ